MFIKKIQKIKLYVWRSTIHKTVVGIANDQRINIPVPRPITFNAVKERCQSAPFLILYSGDAFATQFGIDWFIKAICLYQCAGCLTAPEIPVGNNAVFNRFNQPTGQFGTSYARGQVDKTFVVVGQIFAG